MADDRAARRAATPDYSDPYAANGQYDDQQGDDDHTGLLLLGAAGLAGAIGLFLLLHKGGTTPPPGSGWAPNTLVKDPASAGVWVIDGQGTRHLIPTQGNFDQCNYVWAQILPIDPAVLASLPIGAPTLGPPWTPCVPAPTYQPAGSPCPWTNNLILQDDNTGWSYIVTPDCKKYWISSPAAAAACGYNLYDTRGTQDEKLIGSIPSAGVIAPPTYPCQPFRTGP